MVLGCALLTASRFFGGPERQMLELAAELMPDVQTTFLSFSEGGLCQAFLEKASVRGFSTYAMRFDTPHLICATRELKQNLQNMAANILICHGYKANLLGWYGARSLAIPVIAVSRGWTAENLKIRLYEWLDRRVLRYMDRVVCVSEGQAHKIRQAGVPEEKIVVIHNAIRTQRFSGSPDPAWRAKLQKPFSCAAPCILGAAGRLSPEKGFDVLIRACQRLAQEDTVDFGLVLFGDGPLRGPLQRQIDDAGLTGRVVLAGFTDQFDRYMPHFDVFVQSSHTEGLPNVLLEAAAAAVPIVATDVGGTGEVVADGQTGLLVPAGDPSALASAISRLVADAPLRHALGTAGRRRVEHQFSFAAQARAYRGVFETLHRPCRPTAAAGALPVASSQESGCRRDAVHGNREHPGR